MTKEEAIKTLRELWRETNDTWYEEVYNMAIEALSAEAEQEIVPTVVRVTMSDGSQYYLEHERDAIQAEAVQREWKIDEYGIYHCPFCHAINNTVYKSFCPNCGAIMKGGAE